MGKISHLYNKCLIELLCLALLEEKENKLTDGKWTTEMTT
jgi:hypothetical protein